MAGRGGAATSRRRPRRRSRGPSRRPQPSDRASSTSSTIRSTASPAAFRAGLRIVVDWIVTIVGAVAIVLAIKAWVVNPYRIPSSSMEPTLHCARPAPGCEARFSDRVLANRFIYHFTDPQRGDIVVFETPPAAQSEVRRGRDVREADHRASRGDGRRSGSGGARRSSTSTDGGWRSRTSSTTGADIGPEEKFEVPAGQLLRDGRQPLAVVRLARLGLGARGEPDRQGVHDLLAAPADLVPLGIRVPASGLPFR